MAEFDQPPRKRITPSTYSKVKKVRATKEPPPKIPDTPRPEREGIHAERQYTGSVTPKAWEVVKETGPELRPLLDLEMGPPIQAAAMLRQAIASGKIRLPEIPDQLEKVMATAMRLATTAADAGKTGVFDQMVKLILRIQDSNLEIIKVLDQQARLDTNRPTSITATAPTPDDLARLERIVASQKANVPQIAPPLDTESALGVDSPVAEALELARKEEAQEEQMKSQTWHEEVGDAEADSDD